jgi:ElaB/YqjD/DUF883 family membrane-anchored ribosome-binding protein
MHRAAFFHERNRDAACLLARRRSPLSLFHPHRGSLRIPSIPAKERFMDTTTTSTPTKTGNGSDTMSAAAQATRGTMNETRGTTQRSAATLRSDLSSLKNDLDALVNRSAGMTDDELTQAHAQLMAKFSSVRYAAKGIASEATRQLNRGMETTTEYVKDKPMQSVAVAVGTGLLLGLLFKRR